MPFFVKSSLKVERAYQHLENLNVKVRDFCNRKPHKLLFNEDPSRPDQLMVSAQMDGNVWGEMYGFSLIAGDAIHNLRAALDLMVYEMVNPAEDIAERVAFPFCKRGEDLEQAIRNRHVDRAGPEVVALMMELKPYHRGDESLRAIHDLDVADKHRSLLEVGFHSQIPPEAFDTKVEGQTWMGLRPYAGLKVDLTTTILIGNGLPFAKKPIVETITSLAQLTMRVINAFAALPQFKGK